MDIRKLQPGKQFALLIPVGLEIEEVRAFVRGQTGKMVCFEFKVGPPITCEEGYRAPVVPVDGDSLFGLYQFVTPGPDQYVLIGHLVNTN